MHLLPSGQHRQGVIQHKRRHFTSDALHLYRNFVLHRSYPAGCEELDRLLARLIILFWFHSGTSQMQIKSDPLPVSISHLSGPKYSCWIGAAGIAPSSPFMQVWVPRYSAKLVAPLMFHMVGTTMSVLIV